MSDQSMLEILEKAENQRSARRNFIRLCGGAAAMTGGLSLLAACGDDDDDDDTPAPTPTPTATSTNVDVDVLSFALQLEYLEANYYSYAAFGRGIDAGLQTGVGTQGSVITGSGTGAARQVSFADRIIAEYAREIAQDEIAHVTFLRNALGSSAPSQPTINLSGSATVTAPSGSVVGAFTAAARAANVIAANATFDPFANDLNFLIGSYLLTDVGVSAYRGSARLITNKTFLEASAGILATECYHDAAIRTSLYARGSNVPAGSTAPTVFELITRISNTRDSLDGSSDLDQDIGNATTANLVPTDANALVLGRSATQVLNVVYQNAAAGTSAGGFFPAGVNGSIRTTVTNP